MKRNIWILTLLLITAIQEISAQGKVWTLEDCINYAVTNNIGLQRQRLQNETAEASLLKSRMDLLPSLNFGSKEDVDMACRSQELFIERQKLDSLSRSVNVDNMINKLANMKKNLTLVRQRGDNDYHGHSLRERFGICTQDSQSVRWTDSYRET